MRNADKTRSDTTHQASLTCSVWRTYLQPANFHNVIGSSWTCLMPGVLQAVLGSRGRTETTTKYIVGNF